MSCGRLIRAAVARQRELLADASALQFTRNPEGIGGALRKIGGLSDQFDSGSKIRNVHAETLSHLFFAAPRDVFEDGLFATHLPLPDRIERIYGHAVDFLEAPEIFEDSDIEPAPARHTERRDMLSIRAGAR